MGDRLWPVADIRGFGRPQPQAPIVVCAGREAVNDLLAEGFLSGVVTRLFGLGFGLVLGLDDLVVEPGLVEVEAGVGEVEAGVSNGHAVVVEHALVVELGGLVLGRVLEAAFAEFEFGGPLRFAGLARFDAFAELGSFLFE
jgi:hypothetical protein